jgi:hypothetical protein
MSTNKYFQNFSYGREQDLIEDIIIESIQQYGHDIRYIPRTIVARDNLYSEDRLSTFDTAAEVEVYIRNVDGFEGEGDLLNKFGLSIRDEITFTMARKRFDQIKTEKLLTEVGTNIVFESANTNHPSRQYLTGSADTEALELETATGDGYEITANRPQEGDLIYFPLVSKIFEIKFVEHEQIFYQTGRLQTYDIRCELFEYSSERFETGNTEIDAIEDRYNLDMGNYQVTLESNTGIMLLEDGDNLIQEYYLNTVDPLANNSIFRTQILTDGILDFTESNPWGDEV